ncbi:primase-helicase family protein [Sagittula sp.]|uniref:primase-helicase family protein n=1 Tax=Sagittula sp. TaxID=2038081 RepID=UPI0035132FEF
MKKKLPSLARTPSGLKKEVIAAVRAKGACVTGEAVKRVIEGEDGGADDDGSDGSDAEDDPDMRAAREFLAAVPSIEPAHVWWILENRDLEARQAAELGIGDDDGQEDSPIVEAMKMLRKRYVYAAFRHQFWDRNVRDWIDPKALDEYQAVNMPLGDDGEPMSPVKIFRRDKFADRVHNERFVPGDRSEIVTKDGGEWLNTWKQSEIRPKAGDASWMLDHILYLCNGDQAINDHMLDWMAFAAQNPGVKINHAPLLISPAQGVGKDTLGIALARVLGWDNAYFLPDDALSEGRFDFMKSTSLVVVPEIMCGERREVANKLKPLITQEVVRINEKNVKPYRVTNHANFMMYSNYENAAFIEDQDRRYFVIICRQKPKTPEYFVELYGKIWGEEIGAFAHVLLTRDLSAFNPHAPAPHTEDKDTVRNATQNGVEAWLEDAWHSHSAPFDRDVINTREALKIAQDGGAPRQMSVQSIIAFLGKERIGGGDLGKPRIGPKGNQVRVYAVRDLKKLQKAPMDVIKLCFEGESFARATTIVKTQELQAEQKRGAAAAGETDKERLERYRASALRRTAAE